MLLIGATAPLSAIASDSDLDVPMLGPRRTPGKAICKAAERPTTAVLAFPRVRLWRT